MKKNVEIKLASTIGRGSFFLLFKKQKQYFKNVISIGLMYVFNLLPIKKNKIFFISYYGNQYGCNPKYISEYILKNYPNNTFDVVWAFNDLKTKAHLSGFRKVKTQSLRYFYDLCTSKILITNYRTTGQFIKRKNQYYIQTWHSSLRLKQIEKDAEESLSQEYIKMAKKDSLKCDLLLSGCRISTDIFNRAFWYNGEILEQGTPRNDLFFQETSKLKKELLNHLNVSLQSKIVLYAPTFRKDESIDVYDLNYKEILSSLNKKFGGEWTFLVKLHPHLAFKSGQLVYGDNVIDATFYDDTQKLLTISDVLISDYSSLMFDYCLTKRPCFLYVPDLQNYMKNDRDLYFNIKELPFISAISTKELSSNIIGFNEEKYKNELNSFIEGIGSFETGNASEALLVKINEFCFTKERREKYESEAF